MYKVFADGATNEFDRASSSGSFAGINHESRDVTVKGPATLASVVMTSDRGGRAYGLESRLGQLVSFSPIQPAPCP